MSWILRKKFVVATMLCLVVGWTAIVVNAEEKTKVKVSLAKKPAALGAIHSADLAKSTQDRKLEQTFFPALTKGELKIQEALNADTECKFEDIPLSEVVAKFSERHEINFLIMSNDLGEEGLTVDEPVNFSVKGIALKDALGLILEPIGLTYVVHRGVVIITTMVKADAKYKTRVYPVGDLGNTPEVYLALEAAIKNADLGLWRKNKASSVPRQAALGGGGGAGYFQVISDPNALAGRLHPQVYEEGEGGTITVVHLSESLVISQTYHAHNAIVDLLTQLRHARASK